jgi:hypothetical protein
MSNFLELLLKQGSDMQEGKQWAQNYLTQKLSAENSLKSILNSRLKFITSGTHQILKNITAALNCGRRSSVMKENPHCRLPHIRLHRTKFGHSGFLAPENHAVLHYVFFCSRLSFTVHFWIMSPYIYSRDVGSYKRYCQLTAHLGI